MPMANIWWEAAREALETDEYEAIYQMTECIYNLRTIKEISEQFNKVSKIFIVGYSDNGIIIKQELRRNGVKTEINFCDNNEEKRNLGISKDVVSINETLDFCGDALWVNAVQNGRTEITTQLMSLGISRKKIFECSMDRI